MVPILTIIASSIRKIIQSIIYTPPTSDPYIDNVVLSLRMETSDPYYNQVVLGMHMDDVGLTDVKGHTPTLNGNVARSATQSKFGGYSAYFDGVGDDITFAASTDWQLTNRDFCMEAWIYLETTSNTDPHIMTLSDVGGTVEARIKLTSTRNIAGVIYHTSTYQVNLSGTSVIAINTWYHVAFTRYGNVHSVYVNGIKEASVTVNHTIPTGTILAYVGRVSSALDAYRFKGYIEDLRVTKGVARYTNSFSIPTAAFPEPVNTAIDDTGKTVTTVGNAQYSGLSKYGSGSFYFDGTGDYLAVDDSADFVLGNLDFTIEAWIKPTAYATINDTYYKANIVSQDLSTSRAFSLNITGTASSFTNIEFTGFSDNTTGYTSIVAPYSFSLNTWYHVAAVRSGSLVYIFVNGVCQNPGGTAFSRTLQNSTATLKIGSIEYDATYKYYFTGYIDEVRITKGVARYTTNFTPYQILTNAPAGDPYYNYTALLLKMNGTNGSTTFTDESYTPKTMTVFGNSNISTAQKKYGTASGLFDGTGDYLRTPYNSGFDPGATGDYTAECWIYPTNVTSLRAIFGPYCNTSVTQGWILYQGASGEVTLALRDISGNYEVVSSSASTLIINQWQHVAFTKVNKLYKVWHNGIKVAELQGTIDLYVNPSYGFIVGRWDDSGTTGRDFVGYIDDIRLTKGVARYTSNFTPPGPHIANTDPATDPWWLNTVLALRMDGTHGSTTFTDLKGKTITPYGNASISSAVSKFGQAAYFDGTGDYLSVTGPSFGTGDFCVECWVYPTVNNNALILLDTRTSDNDSTGFGFYLRSTGKLAFIYGNGVVVEGTTTYSANTWYHVAVTRISGTVKLYLNGVQEASFAQGNSYSNTSWKIGHQWNVSGSLTPGYIDDLRVTQGVGRYTAAFTPSEKPLPTYLVGPDHDQYWDKVVLANSFDTSLNDARTKTVTAYGNAAISTGQKMFGAGSVYFDGTGDYITYPHSSDLTLTSGDFTIEAWIYPTVLTNNHFIIKDGVYGSAYPQYALSITSTGNAGAIVGSGTSTVNYQNINTGINVIAINTWSHIAFVRSGTTLKLFIDGILHISATQTATMGTSNGLLALGRQPNDPTYFNGYIDDVRITNGVSRYSESFELPTKANILG